MKIFVKMERGFLVNKLYLMIAVGRITSNLIYTHVGRFIHYKMPTQKTCLECMFKSQENQSHRWTRNSIKFKPIGMRHSLTWGKRKEDQPELKPKWKFFMTKSRKTEDYNSSYQVSERCSVCHEIESSGFPWFISFILFVHFLLVNTAFPILCGFTHISF